MKWYYCIALFCFFSCGSKEKGHVKVTADLQNKSSQKIVIVNSSLGRRDTVPPNGGYQLAGRHEYYSPSKPLCCPCALGMDDFIIYPADSSKKLVKNINDLATWEKHTQIKIENWICSFVIEEGDIQ